jgi:hypothetical protein
VSASHVTRWVRVRRLQLTSLEEAESLADDTSPLDHALDGCWRASGLLHVIRRLDALDRQVIVSYLEDMDAAAIAEITGLSAGAVAMKVHRNQAPARAVVSAGERAMTDYATDSAKELWRMHDEPRVASMSIDDIRKRADLLHASDSRNAPPRSGYLGTLRLRSLRSCSRRTPCRWKRLATWSAWRRVSS